MQEAHIDHSELDRLVEKLAKSPQIIAQAKRQAFEDAAPKLQAAVQAKIGGSGRVRSWQGAFVGSKGGYAAARPQAKTYAESRGKQTYEEHRRKPHPTYAVGYITNAINSGHRTPSHRMGQTKGLRGYRVSTTGWVEGKGSYEAAQDEAESVAQEAAEQIVQALMDHLGD